MVLSEAFETHIENLQFTVYNTIEPSQKTKTNDMDLQNPHPHQLRNKPPMKQRTTGNQQNWETHMLLFIYGTLKRGHHNNRLLAQSQFIETATTQPKYRLYNCGNYPALKYATEGYPIQGEIWQIQPHTLKQLDTLEGTPWLFDRQPIEITNHQNIQGYIYQGQIINLKECKNGEWN